MKQPIPQVLSLLTILLISVIPAATGLLLAPAGWTWTGILSRNTGDYNGYLSIVEEIRHDGWLAHNLLTSEPHPPFQVRPYYTLLALAGRLLPSLSSVTLLEVGRFFSSFCLLSLLLFLSRQVFSEDRDRLVAFWLLATGSGLGWTYLVQDPPDLRIVETSTFLTFLSPPLFTVSLSLLLGILLCLDQSWRAKENKTAAGFAFLAGLLGLWLGFDRPFSLLTLAIAVAIALILEVFRSRRLSSKAFLRALPLAAGAGIAIAYQMQTIREIPIYAVWNRQHTLQTPEPVRLIAAFGFLLPLAVLGFGPLLRRSFHLGILICSYVVASVTLSHLPTRFQERFLEGLPLCLALAASFGLIEILNRISKPVIRNSLAAGAVVMLSLSGFSALKFDIQVLARRSPPQFLPDEMLEGMRQLTNLASPGESVVSTQASGNFIAAYAARPVYLGHSIQTAAHSEKEALLKRLLSLPPSDPEAAKILHSTDARWLFWGPEEVWQARGGFDPTRADFLKRVYSNNLVTIYRILP